MATLPLDVSEDELRLIVKTARDQDATLAHLGAGGVKLEAFKREMLEMYALFDVSYASSQGAAEKVGGLLAELGSLREQESGLARADADSANLRRGLGANAAMLLGRRRELAQMEAQRYEDIAAMEAAMVETSKRIEAGPDWTHAQREEQTTARHRVEAVEAKLGDRRKLTLALRGEITGLTSAMEELQRESDAMTARAAELRPEYADARRQLAQEKTQKRQLGARLRRLQTAVEAGRVALAERQAVLVAEDSRLATLEEQLLGAGGAMDASLRDYDALFKHTESKTEELESLVHRNRNVRAAAAATQADAERGEQLTKRLSRRSLQVSTLVTQARTEVAGAEGAREAASKRCADLRHRSNYELAASLRAARKDADLLRRRIEGTKREEALFARKIHMSQKAGETLGDLETLKANGRKTMTTEVAQTKGVMRRLEAEAARVASEKAGFEALTADCQQRLQQGVEELKIQDARVAELTRRIGDGQAKVKHQQTIYEGVRSERNLQSKNLVKATAEIHAMRARFKAMNYQIDLVKDEVTAKDHRLVREHFAHHSVEKEKDTLRTELSKIKKQILAAEQIIANQRTETLKLNQIIQEALEERQRQQKERDAVASERHILNDQLIRRNDELAKLYEHHKVQRSTLRQGEAVFRRHTGSIADLVERMASLAQRRRAYHEDKASEDEIKKEVIALEEELLTERTKIKALSLELNQPMNVHRWQTLKHRNPRQWEMLKKVQKLQTRLIAQAAAVADRDAVIREKEKLFLELKDALGRQPGHEIADQLDVYQSNLKGKRKQLHAMEHELRMYKQQVAEFQDDVVLSEAQLRDIKRTWIHDMRGRSFTASTGASAALPDAPASFPVFGFGPATEDASVVSHVMQ